MSILCQCFREDDAIDFIPCFSLGFFIYLCLSNVKKKRTSLMQSQMFPAHNTSRRMRVEVFFLVDQQRATNDLIYSSTWACCCMYVVWVLKRCILVPSFFVRLVENNVHTKMKFVLIFKWCGYPLWYFLLHTIFASASGVCCVCHCVKENMLSMILEIHPIKKS